MADLNSFSCTGRLTRDAESVTLGSGTQLVKFGIANNTGYGKYERTQFFNVELWGKTGTAILNYLKKGKQIALTGTLENKAYDGRDGQRHDSWTINSSNVTLLADAKGSAPAQREDDGQQTFGFDDNYTSF